MHRVPDRPSPYFAPFHPSYSRPRLFCPRKLIKIQLIKITYFSSIGVGRRLGDCGGREHRVCAPFDLFFFVFTLLPPFSLSPLVSRFPRVFLSLFFLSFLFFFAIPERARRAFLLFKGGRERYCSYSLEKYGRIRLLGVAMAAPAIFTVHSVAVFFLLFSFVSHCESKKDRIDFS